SQERVSEYLRNLQNNTLRLEKPELAEIKISSSANADIQRRLFDFSLSFLMRTTPEREQLASAGTAQRVQPATP
ncbi:MAG TPA: fimbrial assembly protein, partial [Burkholderiaceae bacterium]|nr:fimbrial assembly protein [Burkholderiaceae bacterium]